MNCPSDITQEVPPGTTQATVTWTPPTATDNITPTNQLQVSETHASGSQFPVGTTPVAYIFTDAANLQSICAFNVIVQIQSKCETLLVCIINIIVPNFLFIFLFDDFKYSNSE